MELTAFEEALVADAAAGNKCDATRDGAVDASAGPQWDPERVVRAKVLEALVTGALLAVHHRGVQLRGAKIQGTLDLSWSKLAQPLSLVQCYFDEPVLAKGARFKDLELSGSRVTGLELTRANIEGSVRLDHGFSATGEIWLLDANIGDLICTGATLSNEGGDVLSADRVVVKGSVRLDQGFSATGGVRLPGAEISGQLNLRGATLSNSGGQAFGADRVVVKGGVLLDQGFSATGEVRLSNAEISGQLNLGGATLSNEGGDVLSADGAVVKGSVFLDEGFSATGEVRLLGAEISGQLNLRGATLRNEGGDVLSADGAVVKGGMFLDQGFSATGAVRLPGTEISGQLNLRGATLNNGRGQAFNAHGAVVKGSMFLDRGFSATGAVSFIGAEISGELNLREATLRNEGGHAFGADRVVVKGNVFLDRGFSATGEVRLPGAEVSGQLNLREATLSNGGGLAFNADGAVVKGGIFLDQGFSATGAVIFIGAHFPVLLWDDENVEGVLDLRHTTVKRLGDRWVRPLKKAGGAVLGGFHYESFVEGTDDSLTLRLAWLRSSPGYTPQPYTQLAAVYRRSGHDDRARKVLIAREVDRRKRGQPSSWANAKSLLLGATVAHGYEPARAVLFLLVLWVMGVALLLGDPGRKAMVPTKTTAVTEPAPSSAADQQPTGLSCPPRYPCFNPWVYSAETVVPLIELGQTGNWQPAGGVNRYQVWVWGATGLGWLFTTLGVAGVTGVIRKD